MSLLITRVRVAFVKVWQPESFQGDPSSKPAYSITGLLEANDPQVDTINDAMDAAAVKKWESKAKAVMAQLRGTDKTCLHNGDLKAQYEGYAGNWYLSARNYSAPLVLDRIKKKPDGSDNILHEKDGRPYGGCYCNLLVDIYATDKGGKRICCSLLGVQFLEDGDAFAGGAPADPEAFPDYLGVDEDSSALA